ncbi:MAG: hypothetical protein R6W77_16815 [Trueperaceae bacterium]
MKLHQLRVFPKVVGEGNFGRPALELDMPDTSPPSEVWSALAHVGIAQWNPTLARALTSKRDLEAADAELARLVPVVPRTAGAEPVVVSDDGDRTHATHRVE